MKSVSHLLSAALCLLLAVGCTSKRDTADTNAAPPARLQSAGDSLIALRDSLFRDTVHASYHAGIVNEGTCEIWLVNDHISLAKMPYPANDEGVENPAIIYYFFDQNGRLIGIEDTYLDTKLFYNSEGAIELLPKGYLESSFWGRNSSEKTDDLILNYQKAELYLDQRIRQCQFAIDYAFLDFPPKLQCSLKAPIDMFESPDFQSSSIYSKAIHLYGGLESNTGSFRNRSDWVRIIINSPAGEEERYFQASSYFDQAECE